MMKKVTIVKKWQKKWKKFISNQCMMRYQYRKSFNVFLFWCIYYATSKKLSLINSWCFRYINNVNTIKYRHFVRSRSFNFAFFFIFTSIYHFTSILVFIIQISMKICEIRKRHRLIWNDLIQRDCKWTLNEFNDLSTCTIKCQHSTNFTFQNSKRIQNNKCDTFTQLMNFKNYKIDMFLKIFEQIFIIC